MENKASNEDDTNTGIDDFWKFSLNLTHFDDPMSAKSNKNEQRILG